MKWLLLTLLCLGTLQQLPDWGTYRPGQLFALVGSRSGQTLQLGIVERAQPGVDDFNQDDVRTLDSEVARAEYLLHDGSGLIEKQITLANGDSVNIRSLKQGAQVWVRFSVLNARDNFYYFLKTQGPGSPQPVEATGQPLESSLIASDDIRTVIANIVDYEPIAQGPNELLVCQPSGQREFTVLFKIGGGQMDFEQLWQAKAQEFQAKVLGFMASHRIAATEQAVGIVTAAVSATLARVGMQDGFVDKLYGVFGPEGQIDVKYSMLLLELLKSLDPALASDLMANQVELLEDSILYGQESLKEVPVP